MTYEQLTEVRLTLDSIRHDLDQHRRKHATRYQTTKSPVDDAVACAVAAALGTLEREIDRIGGGR